MTQQIEKQAAEDKDDLNVDDYEYDDDYENQNEFLFMELRSTASFKDIDIDAMLEHTTFDEFMKGLYANRVASN